MIQPSLHVLQTFPHAPWIHHIANGTHAVCHCGTSVNIVRTVAGGQQTWRFGNWERHCETFHTGMQPAQLAQPQPQPRQQPSYLELSAVEAGLDKLADMVHSDLAAAEASFANTFRVLAERAKETQADTKTMSRALLAADKLLKQSVSMTSLSAIARVLAQADQGFLKASLSFIMCVPQIALTSLLGMRACAPF